MTPPIQLISTDFDGTIFAEFENPPIAASFVRLVRALQSRGATWVINTGRDMSSLMEALGRAHIPVKPDYLVLVEREIFAHEHSSYVGLEEWNGGCDRAHEELFARVEPDVPRLIAWINERYQATLYKDDWSPFCMIAENNGDADVIHQHLEVYCRGIPGLCVVRNDVYARFSHVAYNKGTALAEIARRLSVPAHAIFAVGDHLNDLPMLSLDCARWLAAPANAVEVVKASVRRQGGVVSAMTHGHGVAEALEASLHLASGARFILPGA